MSKNSFLFYLRKLAPLILVLIIYRLNGYLGLDYKYILLPSIWIFPIYHLSQIRKDPLWNQKRWSSIIGLIGQFTFYPALFVRINGLPFEALLMSISGIGLIVHGLMLYLELENSREASIFYIYLISFSMML